MPFYLAKRIQDETGARVYIPLSDDEKYLLKDQSMAEIRGHTRDNLRDLSRRRVRPRADAHSSTRSTRTSSTRRQFG